MFAGRRVRAPDHDPTPEAVARWRWALLAVALAMSPQHSCSRAASRMRGDLAPNAANARQVSAGDVTIRLGATVDLDGPYRQLGTQLRHGLTAALSGARVAGVPVRLSVYNDSYDPDVAEWHVAELIEQRH